MLLHGMHKSTHSELGTLVRLSGPLIAGHAGNQLMGLVDTAMVGRLGPVALAAVGIGNAMYMCVTLLGMGCVLGMEPLVTQAIGAGEEGTARRLLWHGVRVATLVGIPITVLMLLLPRCALAMGVNADLVATCQTYLWGRALNPLPFLLLAAARSYLQALHTTRPIVIAMIVANVTNFLGDALLIFGDAALGRVGLPAVGLPAMGVFGAGLSSSIAGILSFLVLAHAIRGVPTPADQARRSRVPELERRIFYLGLPIGLQILAEVAIFSLVSLLAGRIGTTAAAGHQVAITLASFTFTVTLGISSAAAVRVGHAVGRKDLHGARVAGLLGIGLGAAFMALAALAFLFLPAELARLLTDDPVVLGAAIPLLRVAAVFQLSDGVQAVAAGALRGAGDTRAPLWAIVAGYYAVGLPVAVLFGLHLGMGAPGLWWGLVFGLTAVAVGLVWRFLRISARPIARA
jgi:MATE family multidrug resistance protein